RGHILMEDVPGTGKTRLALALARSLGVEFRRIQGTPDLLPGDVLGSSVFHESSGDFVFRPGPIFANVVLVDEINRTTPRTQSAFLEAMQEGAVSVDGTTRPLPTPFLLIATQNPIDLEGTFPLPEAQLDRFLLRAPMPYPDRDQERRMVLDFGRGDDPGPAAVTGAVSVEDLARLRSAADAAVLSPEVAGYLVDVIRATREDDALRLPASPRSAVALARAARARAVLAGRSFVTPDDVKDLAVPVLAHRLVLNREAELRGDTAAAAIRRALDRTPVPVEHAAPAGRD
ncbi:MAG TPA: AAA family ATPase, partial [Bacillota bacterium]